MRLIISAICVIISTLTIKAENNLDSLYAAWQNDALPDSSRAQAYHDYIWEGFLFTDPDSAFNLAEELVAFSQSTNYSKAKAAAFNIQGISFYFRGNYPRALDYYQRSLKICEIWDDKQRIAGLQGNIGLIYGDQGNNQLALKFHQQSLKMREQLGDQKGISRSLNNIGTIYFEQKNYPKALEYFQNSLKIKQEIGDQKGISNTLNNIGNIFKNLGDFSKALEYQQKGLIIQEDIGDKKGVAISLANIGAIYQKQEDFPKALEYYQRSMQIQKVVEDMEGIALSMHNIGLIYNTQGKYSEAIIHCQKSLNLSEEIGSVERQKQACTCLYKSYKSLGNAKEALSYHEKILVLSDSLDADETSKKLMQMEFTKQVFADSLAAAEETRLVEEAHQEEIKKKNRTRNIAIGGIILVLLLAGVNYNRLRFTRKAKAIIEKEKDRSEHLLLNILPADIAEELKAKGKADAKDFDLVSILFSDFKGFTEVSAKLSAHDLVSEIHACFKAFDSIMEKYGIEKIKTIGDAYMAAGGLPVPTDNSAKHTVFAALEMQAFIAKRKALNDAAHQPAFEMRVGIHTGPVVAGIVGVKKFQYDIWGDTVNTASRLESNGEAGKINISQATYELLKDDADFAFESRGRIEAKGKGEIEMYFVSIA